MGLKQWTGLSLKKRNDIYYLLFIIYGWFEDREWSEIDRILELMRVNRTINNKL